MSDVSPERDWLEEADQYLEIGTDFPPLEIRDETLF